MLPVKTQEKLRTHSDAPSTFAQPSIVLLLALIGLQLPAIHAFTVCVIPDGVWTSCTVNTTGYTSFTGYDVELFRYVASQVGWHEDPNNGAGASIASGTWAFRCSTWYWDVMSEIMTTNNTDTAALGPCAVAIGDFIPTVVRYDMGVQFSAPYFHTGLAIMAAQTDVISFDKWGFLKPFHWTMWVGLGLTLLFMPGVVWFVERLNVMGFIPVSWSAFSECKLATYSTLLACFNIQVYEVTTLPAQFVVILYLFLVLITVSTYTANLAAVFTNAGTPKVTIKSWRDLQHKRTAAPGVYCAGLEARYNLTDLVPGGLGNNLDLLKAGKAGLLDGSIAAYVTNLESIQQFIGPQGYNQDCRLTLVLFDVLEPAYNFAFAFHHQFPRTLVATNVSSAIALAEESGLLYNLHLKYIQYTDTCLDTALPGSESVRFYQLSGLWILLAAALGFAICWTMVTIANLARQHVRDISLERRTTPYSPNSSAHLLQQQKSGIVAEAISRVFVPPSRAASRAQTDFYSWSMDRASSLPPGHNSGSQHHVGGSLHPNSASRRGFQDTIVPETLVASPGRPTPVQLAMASRGAPATPLQLAMATRGTPALPEDVSVTMATRASPSFSTFSAGAPGLPGSLVGAAAAASLERGGGHASTAVSPAHSGTLPPWMSSDGGSGGGGGVGSTSHTAATAGPAAGSTAKRSASSYLLSLVRRRSLLEPLQVQLPQSSVRRASLGDPERRRPVSPPTAPLDP